MAARSAPGGLTKIEHAYRLARKYHRQGYVSIANLRQLRDLLKQQQQQQDLHQPDGGPNTDERVTLIVLCELLRSWWRELQEKHERLHMQERLEAGEVGETQRCKRQRGMYACLAHAWQEVLAELPAPASDRPCYSDFLEEQVCVGLR